MSGKTLRRFVTASGLAALLALAGAAPAYAWDRGPDGRTWQWIQNLWTKGLSVLWDGDGKFVPAPEKEGWGLDPNGSPQRPAGIACQSCGDQGPSVEPRAEKQGWGMDPNGSPQILAGSACQSCRGQGPGMDPNG